MKRNISNKKNTSIKPLKTEIIFGRFPFLEGENDKKMMIYIDIQYLYFRPMKHISSIYLIAMLVGCVHSLSLMELESFFNSTYDIDHDGHATMQ